jgi:hypothetical protein
VPIKTIFETPTIEGLAHSVEEIVMKEIETELTTADTRSAQ